ncbi:hypothetical protein LTR85_005427 [Meristemomyces frigidus]|nr:hypothetical protein LTR85_005427 [Meristemomyces frigidus]
MSHIPPSGTMAESSVQVQNATPAACLLLALPPELRTQIWTYLLCSTANLDGVVRVKHRPKHYKTRRPSHTVLTVLQTCHQIRAEAEGLFYHLNHIYLRPYRRWWTQDRTRPLHFLASLNLIRASSLRTVTCEIYAFEEMTTAVKTCQRLPRLATVYFQIAQTLGGVDDWGMEELVREQFEREWPFLKRALRGRHYIKDVHLIDPAECSESVVRVVQM